MSCRFSRPAPALVLRARESGPWSLRVNYDAEEDFTFALVDNTGKPFKIDASTGVITTTGALDHETKPFYDVEVTLKGKTSQTTTTKVLRLDVADVDETPSKPTFATTYKLDANQFYGVDGGTTGKIGALASTDPEGGAISYAVSAQFIASSGGGYKSSDAFAVVNGELRAVKPLAAGFYFVDVNAEDAGRHASPATALQFKVSAPNAAPAITSNDGGAAATLLRKENTKAVTTLTVSDAADSEIGYTIVGGADAARFTLDDHTGALAFASTPNFESPRDAGKNNTYEVKVRATDQGGLFDEQTIAVRIADVNEYKPSITSNGKGASAKVGVDEGKRAVTTVKADDADGSADLTYSLSGGTDKSDFSINADTGKLSFKSTPNYENPKDSNKDNVYKVIVKVSDGTKSDTQTLTVKVKDVGGPNKLLADSHNDTFVFEKGDGGKTPGSWDKVYGFTPGHDTIDLSRIDADPAHGDQAFRFVHAFSAPKAGEADGQVRVVDYGKDVKVLIDYDGNNSIDMVLQVMNVAKLTAGDFHL